MSKELLARIEKLEDLTARLEQGIQDIWLSCDCLRKDLEDNFDPPNCEPPTCEECGEFSCVCEPEDETIYCPEQEEPEEPEEEYDD